MIDKSSCLPVQSSPISPLAVPPQLMMIALDVCASLMLDQEGDKIPDFVYFLKKN